MARGPRVAGRFVYSSAVWVHPTCTSAESPSVACREGIRMEYVIGLFDTREHAEVAIESLRRAAIDYRECMLRDRENMLRDWLERLFDMDEPQASMEPHGLHRNLSEWLDRQLDLGKTMVVALVAAEPERAQHELARAGASEVRRVRWWPAREPSVFGDNG
jgi:hypothetical protein